MAFGSQAAAAGANAPQNTPELVFQEIVSAAQGAYSGMDTGDKVSALAGPIPILGDAMGVINDLRNFATGRSELTPTNAAMSAMGVLPFVPSGMAGIISRASKGEASAYEVLEKETLKRSGKKDFVELSTDEIYDLERASGGILRDPVGNLVKNIDTPDSKLNLEYQIATKMRNDTDDVVIGTKKYIDDSTGKGYPTDYAIPKDRLKDARPMVLSDFIEGLPEVGKVSPSGIPTDHVNLSSGVAGFYDPYSGELGVATRLNSNANEVRAITHHEYGHTVQNSQGLPGGSSPQDFAFYGKKPEEIPEKPTVGDAKKAYEAYRRDVGETYADASANYDVYFAGIPKEDRPSFGVYLDSYARGMLDEQGIDVPGNKSAALFSGISLLRESGKAGSK